MSEPQPQTVEQYKAALHDEWSKYTAKEPIFIDGARAFNTDDPVPVSHVERGVVTEQQVKSVSKTEAAKTQTANHTPAEKKD